jgi:hypothetical protein
VAESIGTIGISHVKWQKPCNFKVNFLHHSNMNFLDKDMI